MPLTKHNIAAEDLYRFELIVEPRLSPDGCNILYSQTRIDRKTEKKYSNLWIVPFEGGQPTQFTYGDQSDTHARWSPDGSLIAFLSDRRSQEKPVQVFLIPFGGGEARQLTALDGEIVDYTWSPNGKQLLCTVRKLDPEELERQTDEHKKKLGVVSRRYERLLYKLDGYGYLPHERTHLWLITVKTGRAVQLTDHPVHDQLDPAWSPDGKSIVYRSNICPDPDSSPDYDDLFILPASGGEPVRQPTPIGVKSHPAFSPDGRLIAYFAVEGEAVDYKNLGLWVVPAGGSGSPNNQSPARCLTDAYDLNCAPDTVNDQGSPEQMPPTWSKDGQRLFFTDSYHGSSVLRSISIDGTDLQTIIPEGGVVGSYTFDTSQARLAYFYGKMDDPGQIYTRQLAARRDRPVTRLNRAWLDRIDLGRVEEIWFKGGDGNDLQGWILTPPGFDPSKKYPSIMEIHGGPLVQYGNFFMHEFYYLAAQGYVVYFCNPRGGRGYGQDHAAAIHADWGAADYADLMAWADRIASLPYIDPGRMGVTGGSYGGYMTVWMIGHTDRFKAAVTQRCVSNFVSLWGSSDYNWTFQLELNKKPPFESLDYYWDHSPLKYIGNAKTPTLVIHNEMDHRCPIEQGEQVFVALRRLGIDSEFVRFPDEFHGLSRTGRTDRRIVRLNAISGWFDKYLK
jgi:dipeptidyl aminopeptidase/acylaminoacyl peptidase